MQTQNELAQNNALYRRLMRQFASEERMLERVTKENNTLAMEIIKASMLETKAEMKKMEAN